MGRRIISVIACEYLPCECETGVEHLRRLGVEDIRELDAGNALWIQWPTWAYDPKCERELLAARRMRQVLPDQARYGGRTMYLPNMGAYEVSVTTSWAAIDGATALFTQNWYGTLEACPVKRIVFADYSRLRLTLHYPAPLPAALAAKMLPFLEAWRSEAAAAGFGGERLVCCTDEIAVSSRTIQLRTPASEPPTVPFVELYLRLRRQFPSNQWPRHLQFDEIPPSGEESAPGPEPADSNGGN